MQARQTGKQYGADRRSIRATLDPHRSAVIPNAQRHHAVLSDGHLDPDMHVSTKLFAMDT